MTKKDRAKIKRLVAAKRRELESINAEFRKRLRIGHAELGAIQDQCSHPDTYSDGGSYGGPDFADTWCKICGKRL